MYGDALVGFGMVLGGYGCFNRPHDGYANRSNSKTSLPTDSRIDWFSPFNSLSAY